MINNPAVASVAGAFVSGAMIWATIIIRLLWQFKGKWDQTNSELATMRHSVTELTAADRTLQAQLEGHLLWHQQRGQNSGFHGRV